MVRDNSTFVLKAELLSRHGFVHGFSLRSTDPILALRALGIDEVFQTSQVHGAGVVVAEGDPGKIRQKEGDALLIRTPRAAAAVRVADCVPVLVGARQGAALAIHAGWRGIVRGVVAAALAQLTRAGGLDPVAAIGPCIGPCCFEVGLDVANQIAEAAGVDVVATRKAEKAYVDLRRAVRAQLRACGVVEIEDVAGCTKHEPERFFSFRREGANAGRQVGFIVAH
jgi:YfiH family protein